MDISEKDKRLKHILEKIYENRDFINEKEIEILKQFSTTNDFTEVKQLVIKNNFKF
jgi:hypothetical protein